MLIGDVVLLQRTTSPIAFYPVPNWILPCTQLIQQLFQGHRNAVVIVGEGDLVCCFFTAWNCVFYGDSKPCHFKQFLVIVSVSECQQLPGFYAQTLQQESHA